MHHLPLPEVQAALLPVHAVAAVQPASYTNCPGLLPRDRAVLDPEAGLRPLDPTHAAHSKSLMQILNSTLQVLEPLQMACTMDVPRIAEPALGCLHKLVWNHSSDQHNAARACYG